MIGLNTCKFTPQSPRRCCSNALSFDDGESDSTETISSTTSTLQTTTQHPSVSGSAATSMASTKPSTPPNSDLQRHGALLVASVYYFLSSARNCEAGTAIGSIAGGVVGGAAFVILCLGFAYYLRRKRRLHLSEEKMDRIAVQPFDPFLPPENTRTPVSETHTLPIASLHASVQRMLSVSKASSHRMTDGSNPASEVSADLGPPPAYSSVRSGSPPLD